MTTAVEFLQIDPTTRCNFSCAYCRGRHMPPADISPALFRAALYLFPAVRYLELHGEGEPLLNPELFALAAEAQARGMALSLFTNGSRFTPENVAALLDMDLNKVVVSLDSADPVLFRAARGGQLAEVTAGIELLLRRRAQRGLDRPAVGISATLRRDTLEGISALAELARSLGLDGGLDYQGLNPMADYARHYPPELAAQAVPLAELDALFAPLRTDPLLGPVITGTSPLRGFYDELFAPVARSERFCPWLRGGAYVTVNGFVTPCCMLGEEHAYGRVDAFAINRYHARRNELQAALAAGVVPETCRGCELAAIIAARNAG